MATYVQYGMRIDGRLTGSQDADRNKAALDEFTKLMMPAPTPGGSGAGWPQGFLFQAGGFKPMAAPWKVDASRAGKGAPETKINFFGVISDSLPGSVDDNQQLLNGLSQWLHSYQKQPWFLDLIAKLDALNKKYGGGFIDRFYIREWSGGFSDGGDM